MRSRRARLTQSYINGGLTFTILRSHLEVFFFGSYYLITSILHNCSRGCDFTDLKLFTENTCVTVARVNKCQVCVLISRRIAALDVLKTFRFEKNWT